MGGAGGYARGGAALQATGVSARGHKGCGRLLPLALGRVPLVPGPTGVDRPRLPHSRGLRRGICTGRQRGPLVPLVEGLRCRRAARRGSARTHRRGPALRRVPRPRHVPILRPARPHSGLQWPSGHAQRAGGQVCQHGRDSTVHQGAQPLRTLPGAQCHCAQGLRLPRRGPVRRAVAPQLRRGERHRGQRHGIH